MANVHFRVPVTLDVRLDVDDPVARVHKWRTWPDVVPNTGVVILMRVCLTGCYYYIAGYLDGAEFVDSAGRPVFRDDQDEEDTVFERRTPDELHWIPLGELLEGVEDAEEQE